ncbi:Zn-dependent metalloprotease [Paenibacillus phyllosphaerae]|uniref:Neutral metalloproteinase n=1 Tax=Paenibacillus phyllosphaerae TaxID=274593 RepID=A0A7W5AUF9_9BACL|nr:M4 family metallopeptidase [Paenibacillus phyllosphaerae]MBB3108892.1 Zn-dependent metalloprotease [Paenibacillus phyllosphaerae]
MKKRAAAAAVLASLITSSIALSGGDAYAQDENQVYKNENGEIHTIVGDLQKLAGATPQERAFRALEQVKGDYGIRDVSEFVPGEVVRNGVVTSSSPKSAKSFSAQSLGDVHTKFDRKLDGIPVYGEQLIMHEKNGQFTGVTGKYKALKETASAPVIGLTEAIERAISFTGFSGQLSVPAAGELVYLPVEDQAVLAYKVTVCYLDSDSPGDWILFVNAVEGEVIRSLNKLAGVKSTAATTAGTGSGASGAAKLHTVKKGADFYLEDRSKAMYLKGGTITTYTFNYGSISQTYVTDKDNVWTDEAAVDAHVNVGKVYDYLLKVLGRDSYDGQGTSIVSGVHYSNGYNNAFWSGAMQQMVYGDGDGAEMSSLSSGLDVTAHELFHAVTEYTSGLEYYGQSGALNESWSDAFGAAVDGDDWMIGEDIWTPGVPGDALRYMDDPTKGDPLYAQPGHMDDYVDTYEDNGGVHINSGIPNKAFYKFATSIGSRDEAIKIWYLAATAYMTPTTDFSGAREATLLACKELYDKSSSTYKALEAAWTSVGVK